MDNALAEYVSSWRSWQDSLVPLDADKPPERANTYRASTAVLRTHEARSFAGGYIASLSIPWGFHKGDEDLGGYHLVWPRDLVETAGGLLAAGAKTEAREVVYYLRAIQEADGHWAQNSWLDGTPYWHGVQMDECAFPILLVDLAWREGALREPELRGLWPMVKRAAEFIVRNGPVTGQDRWEEAGGYSPFTLSVEIAALPQKMPTGTPCFLPAASTASIAPATSACVMSPRWPRLPDRSNGPITAASTPSVVRIASMSRTAAALSICTITVVSSGDDSR